MSTKKFEILFVGSFPPPFHGSAVYFKNIVEHPLINEKFEVRTLNTSDPRTDLENQGKLDFVNIKTGLANLLQFFRACLKEKPNLIYINTPQGLAYLREGLFILVAKLFFRTKVIQHLHGSEFLNFYSRTNVFMKLLIRVTQKRVNYSIVLGKNLKYIFKKWNKIENIFSVPNGIEPEINFEKRSIGSRLPVLFFFGNLYKFKGLMLVLDVLEIIKKKYPGIKLNIAGNWGYDWYFNLSQNRMKEMFYNAVREKNLQDNINFIGPAYNEDKINLLKNSDILIYPTYMDGFPIVLIEAMSAGCPVVTAKMVGAISEVVVHNETGFLITDYSAENYAEAVLKIIENPGLFEKMSENSQKRFKEKYTLETNIKKMIQTFEKVLNKCVE